MSILAYFYPLEHFFAFFTHIGIVGKNFDSFSHFFGFWGCAAGRDSPKTLATFSLDHAHQIVHISAYAYNHRNR